MTSIPEVVQFHERPSEKNPLLDTQETSGYREPKFSFRAFMVSGVAKDVTYNERIYKLLDDRDGSTRHATYVGCRTSAWFVRSKMSGLVKLISSRCNLRWCPLCIRTKRVIMMASIVPWVEQARSPKFVTFTLKHSDSSLDFQIDRLYTAFRKLRKNKLFKNNAKGGIWFFQVKRSKNDGLWHPHLHCIIEGNFIQKELLQDEWERITKDSRIVDIRAIKDAKKTSDYVARYASAPCRLADLSESDACDVVDTLHGRRVCGTWGTAKGVQLTPKRLDDSEGWEYLAGYAEVMMMRHRYDWHAAIYHAFVKDEPCYSVPDPPKPPPWESAGGFIAEPQTQKQLTFEWTSFFG